jgi:hypothetical protein
MRFLGLFLFAAANMIRMIDSFAIAGLSLLASITDGENQEKVSAGIHTRQGEASLLQSSFAPGAPGLDPQTAMHMPPVLGSDGGLEFIHIPKAAGTTVEDSANSQGVFWGRFGNLSRELWWNGTGCAWWHVPTYLQDVAPAWFQAKEKFCVTREPYDRMISEYRYWLTRYLEGGPAFMKASGPLLSEIFHHSPYPHCSSEALNYFLQEAFMKYRENQNVFGCHFLPQSKFIWRPNGTAFCDHLVRLEEFPQSFDNLMISRGSPVRLGEKSNEGHACNGFDELAAVNLTNTTRALIEKTYFDDFVHLNYPLWIDGIEGR